MHISRVFLKLCVNAKAFPCPGYEGRCHRTARRQRTKSATWTKVARSPGRGVAALAVLEARGLGFTVGFRV